MSRTGAVFTLHLRAGHKWSDGQPFTIGGFPLLVRGRGGTTRRCRRPGLPVALLPNGEPPRFEVLDQQTVRYSWSRPNPLFLPALAGPTRSSSTPRRIT